MSDLYRASVNPRQFLQGKAGWQSTADPVSLFRGITAIGGVQQTANRILFDGTIAYRINSAAHNFLRMDLVGGLSPIRFLPFKPNHVTYQQVDPAASLIFTSALSGCNMYVKTITAGVNAGVWLFHANANATPGLVTGNGIKRVYRNGALAALGAPGGACDINMERGNYPGGAQGGIFFGQKVAHATTGAPAWGFYFYNPITGQVHPLISTVAATNATI
ncbi:hypothetical protein SAMN02745866_01200 [Alteromonadaceae bacterium Bs31]|nr:hypothetical protein SAMN02745866_01200 [Alteromonadaceae bacterium Bs31]